MDRAALPPAIIAERQRQIDSEGWTPEHDAEHDNGEMLSAATMYWQRAIGVPLVMRLAPMKVLIGRSREGRFARPEHYSLTTVSVPVAWPWEPQWWKPKTAVRDLERAGALCLAEIDRLSGIGKSVAHVEETLAHIVSAYAAQS